MFTHNILLYYDIELDKVGCCGCRFVIIRNNEDDVFIIKIKFIFHIMYFYVLQ